MAMLRIGQGALPPRLHAGTSRRHRTHRPHQELLRQPRRCAATGPPSAASSGPQDPTPLLYNSNGSGDPSASDPAAPGVSSAPETAAPVPPPPPPSAAHADPPAKPTSPPFPSELPTAPWTISTTLTVMAVWLVCFYVAAYDVVPFFLRSLGFGGAVAASQPGVQALRHLLLDATQLGVTLLLLRRALAPHAPRSLGLFAARFRPLRSWLPTVLAGAATFPVVDFVHKQIVALLAGAPAAAAPPAAGNAAFLTSASWEVRTAWFLVLAVCAPLWEEIMFRGFLLPSLARYIGPAWAVAASSLVFATVHFTQEGFVPLLLLGVVFGGAYLRTRNLIPAVALHSMWNVCLLTQILTGA